MFSRRRDGVSLRPSVDGPTYEGKTNGRAHVIDASAIVDGDRLHVFTTNRHVRERARVDIRLGDRSITALDSAELLTGPDAKAANTFEQPHSVVSCSFDYTKAEVRVSGDGASLWLPPLSLAAMTFRL
jgi:alpha-L-arabinofuranosidase